MITMAKIELPYVKVYSDRHGRRRHYFRRPGYRSCALPGEPGSPSFMQAYQAAAEDPISAGERRTKPKSVSALIVAYYGTAEFKRLEDSTKRTYRNMLDRFRIRFGDRSAVTIQTRHLDAIFDDMADRPGAARNLRKRLRRVFRLAVKLGWRPDNPVNETDAPEPTAEGFIPWSEDDIAAFQRRWEPGTRQRRALALLLCTGVRRSNAIGLGRQHDQGSHLRFTVFKGRKKKPTILTIPIHTELRAELDLAPPDLTFLLTQYGKPFSAAGFTQWFVEQAELAGLKNRTPHGLRKAAGRRLAEAGCTAKEIAAITGHKTLSEVERYTRDADQVRLADRAMSKLRGEA